MNLSSLTIRFQLFGVPIVILPSFWLLCIMFSPFLAPQSGENRPWIFGAFGWIAALFLSFIVHELGHALAARRLFRVRPEITLGIGAASSGAAVFGGVTTWSRMNEQYPNRPKRAVVSAAGPLSQLAVVFLGFVVATLIGTTFIVDKEFGFIPVLYPLELVARSLGTSAIDLFVGYFCLGFFFINTFWCIINLIPIYPLDGGHVMMAALAKNNSGIRCTFYTSIVFAFLIGGLFIKEGSWFAGCFFLYLAFANYNAARAYESS